MAARGHDRSALPVELRLRVEGFLAQDEEIAFGHAVSLPVAAD
jgi:hypothetical protein